MSPARQAMTPTWIPCRVRHYRATPCIKCSVRAINLSLSDVAVVPLQERDTGVVRLQAARVFLPCMHLGVLPSRSSSCSQISFDENIEVDNVGTNPHPTASDSQGHVRP